MPSKKELGRRLRLARFRRGFTLKDVARRCGMSATHISEVERGKTSPTIGALQRIATALGENPSVFVTDESLSHVVFTRTGHRCDLYVTDATGKPDQFQIASPGIPGGIMQVFTRTIAAGSTLSMQPRIGEIVIVCLKGTCKFAIGDDSIVLRESDAVQFKTEDGYEAEILGDEEYQGVAFLASPVLVRL